MLITRNNISVEISLEELKEITSSEQLIQFILEITAVPGQNELPVIQKSPKMTPTNKYNILDSAITDIIKDNIRKDYGRSENNIAE